MAEIVPNTARNWRKERFRKYTRPLPETSTRRRRWVGCRRWDKPPACPSERSSDVRASLGCTRQEPYATGSSCDAPHADQVSEDDAFQGLRGGHPGVAAAAAHRHGL